MSHGKVTFLSVVPDALDTLPWRATKAIAEADIVIWTTGTVRQDVLDHAHDNADVVAIGGWSTYSLMPFYDLASRDGFLIAHIRSDNPTEWDDVFEQLDRCCELGLETEIVRCAP
ncbi:MAG: hypothetical protein ACRDQ7_21180 [Haloechinothrix sp.]